MCELLVATGPIGANPSNSATKNLPSQRWEILFCILNSFILYFTVAARDGNDISAYPLYRFINSRYIEAYRAKAHHNDTTVFSFGNFVEDAYRPSVRKFEVGSIAHIKAIFPDRRMPLPHHIHSLSLQGCRGLCEVSLPCDLCRTCPRVHPEFF